MKIKLLITSFLFPVILFGQDMKHLFGNRKIDITPYITLGAQFLQTPKLNGALKRIGYKTPANTLVSLGTGLKISGKAFEYGIDFLAALPVKRSVYTIQFQGLLSYKIINTGKFSFAPEIGIGSQRINIFLNNIAQSNNFDSLVLSSGNYTRLNSRNTILSLAGIVHFKTKRILLHPISHIRFGYTYAVKSKQWRSGGNIPVNSPADHPGSFNIQFYIGRFF